VVVRLPYLIFTRVCGWLRVLLGRSSASENIGSVASAKSAVPATPTRHDRFMRRRSAVPPVLVSEFTGFRFPPEVIVLAVRWYLRYALSYRDVEELLAERGIHVDHVTIYRWVRRFTLLLIDAARPCRHAPGDRWLVERATSTQSISPHPSSNARISGLGDAVTSRRGSAGIAPVRSIG
jgi:hypothetical protein